MTWAALAAGIIVGTALLYLHDKRQTSDPVLRRFPVLAWGRKVDERRTPCGFRYVVPRA